MLRTVQRWLRRPRPVSPLRELSRPGTTRLGDLSGRHDAWQTVEGFHQPDWAKIGAWIKGRTADQAERATLWHDASLQWLDRLRRDLGEPYDVVESRFCLLLSARSPFAARQIAAQCDAVLQRLRARLGQAAWRWPHGKHAVLMFEDQESYYRYISHFYKEDGVYGTTSGIFLRRGYAHTALIYSQNNLDVLAHEFVHLCLSPHRTIPRWLNEGLAQHLEREIFDPQARGFDREAAKKQRTFWTPGTIGRFWSGASFRVDEECRMSYNLAELLVGLLMRECKDLEAFIPAAHRRDAGESAAREHLGVGLGEVAAAVLGEGDWRPGPPPAEGSTLSERSAACPRPGEPGR